MVGSPLAGTACGLGAFLFGVETFLKLLAQFYTRGLLDMSVGVHQHIRRGVSCGALNGLHIAAGDHQLIEGPVEHCWVRKSLCFQPPHKVVVLLLVNKGFLFFSFRALTAAFDGVLVFPHQNKTFSKKASFGV